METTKTLSELIFIMGKIIKQKQNISLQAILVMPIIQQSY